MKKTAITILLALSTSGLFAQTAYDALMLSENSYEGTARSAAMGNAFTALGGDLGAVTINPAGSAMASYSQITVTPGITISSTTAEGVSPYENGDLPYFQRKMKSSLPKGSLPNIGASINFDTGRNYGLVNWSLGFIVNKTADYNQDVYANGRNSTTSFIGQMAYEASRLGFYPDELGGENAYDSGINWKYVTGFKSAMFDPFNDIYVAATEMVYDDNTCFVAGELDQTYGRRTRGDKYEYIINAGFNISDFVYFGMNLGINSISYSYDEYFKETAVDPSNFVIELQNGKTIYFDSMKYKYSYSVNTSGVYGKFGIILTPGAGIRFGAAIQTPTATNVNEFWQMYGETNYTDNNFNASASSPEGEDYYNFSEPWRANFGLAYTLGKLAVFSVDYELCDYSAMKFKRNGFDDGREYFSDLNDDIKDIFGTSHMLRAGVEVKPVDRLAVRAGYGLTTAPELTEVPAAQNASFGLGFNSRKSFFADIACRYAFASDEYFMPYSDYMAEYEVYAPEIRNRKDAWKVLLTLGWRF